MNEKISTLEKILNDIEGFPFDYGVYLPSDEKWQLGSRAAVLEEDEVLPEEEDEPDAGVPQFAKDNKLKEALQVSMVQSIVENSKAQISNISIEKLFEAFLYYYDNDAYIDWTK
jgi:hypothetical protein